MPSVSSILRITRAIAHSVCGWLAYRVGFLGAAQRQFERALLLRGDNFRAYVHLGQIAFAKGDYASWRREFEHARRTDPIRFARLRHGIELFQPRLAGTQFDCHHALDGYLATDARATWRSLHPFGQGQSQFGEGSGSGLLNSGSQEDNWSSEGFVRGTDLPLAPGYDPMAPGQQLDNRDPNDVLHKGNSPLPHDPTISDFDAGDPFGQAQKAAPSHPEWATPDASLCRDDFSSPTERRRFQLRRPIDKQEIAHCDLNELTRRLSS